MWQMPLILGTISLALGLNTFGYFKPCAKVAVCYNTFIAVFGSLMPVVWFKFITEGITSWPYEVFDLRRITYIIFICKNAKFDDFRFYLQPANFVLMQHLDLRFSWQMAISLCKGNQNFNQKLQVTPNFAQKKTRAPIQKNPKSSNFVFMFFFFVRDNLFLVWNLLLWEHGFHVFVGLVHVRKCKYCQARLK